MLAIVIAMFVILLLAAAVVLYAAFPHRGEDLPGAPWLGDAMGKAVDAVPTLDEDYADDRADHALAEVRLLRGVSSCVPRCAELRHPTSDWIAPIPG